MSAAAKYRTIVADPPWDVKAGPLAGGEFFVGAGGPSRDLPYPPLSVDEIAALDVRGLADQNCHLYLWTINKYLEDAFRVVRAWGFAYSTTLVWTKNPMGGGLGGTFGITTEFVLFATRGVVGTEHRASRTTWFNWKRAYDERGKPKHSAKPPAFLDLVEQVSPGPYLELFARSQRLGWDSWGNEALEHVTLA